MLLEEWLNALCVHYLPYPYVMRGELTFDQALDQNIESAKDKPLDFKRLEMIVDLYFPGLRTPLDRVHAAREDANKIIEKYKKRYKERSTDGSAFLQPFLNAEKTVAGRKSWFAFL